MCGGLTRQSCLNLDPDEVPGVLLLPHLLPCHSSYCPPPFALFWPSFSVTLVPVTGCCGRATRRAWWRRPWRCSSSLRARSAGSPIRAQGWGRDGAAHRSLVCRGAPVPEPAWGRQGIACLLRCGEVKPRESKGERWGGEQGARLLCYLTQST